MGWIIHLETTPEKRQANLQLIGRMDEHTHFQGVPANMDHFVLDCSMIEGINSLGIRAWIQWIQKLTYKTFHLEKCPKVLVDQFSQVAGFLRKDMIVTSFEVPYVSEDGLQEKRVYFSLGAEFDEAGRISAPQVLDQNGKPMEIDAFQDKYFAFLRKAESTKPSIN